MFIFYSSNLIIYSSKGVKMHERRFNGGLERLRSAERIALLEIDRVVKLSLDNKKIKSVLDVGTGTGLFAEAFASRDLDVTGIDVSESMLSIVGTYVPSGKFKLAPAENIPFPDKSFDLTFFGLVLHETDDLVAALKEARRVTVERIAVLEWPYKNSEQGPPLEHRIKPDFLKKLIKEVGFKDYEKIILKNLELFILTP